MNEPFPKPSEAERYFGKITLDSSGLPSDSWQRAFLQRVDLPYPMRPSWDQSETVRSVMAHRTVAKSLANALEAVLNYFRATARDELTTAAQTTESLEPVSDAQVNSRALAAIREAGLDQFAGTFIFSPTPSGKALSFHAYGAAISLDPANNPPGKKYPEPEKEGKEPKPHKMIPADVVAIFKENGWSWGGDWKNPCCGIFQASQ